MTFHAHIHETKSLFCLGLTFGLLASFAGLASAPLQAQAPPRELTLTVGKAIVLNSAAPIERVSVGFGEVIEATPVGPQELLVQAKTPGETSLIVWQKGGNTLVFDVVVEPNLANLNGKVDKVRQQIDQELPGQKVSVVFHNDAVFLRGTVKDMVSAGRAVSIASTLGKVVNLLYVDVPQSDAQVLLKVQFASVDRNVSSELGLNLVSTGATNTIGSVSTGQFSLPRKSAVDTASPFSLSDALNIFLFRPDLNLAATIRALQTRGLFEILAEPNVLAINGKQASFVAGGEFPYPTLQGGGGGLGQVTIQFREFGVRINFIPVVTPRGTIKLEVAPEVSALDFTNGLTFQGFTIPGLTLRRVQTGIELESGQSFAIGGLLDRRLTETMQKIPLLADVPLLGKLFQSRSLTKENTELLVIVTPELVRPIQAGQPRPQLQYPEPLAGPDVQPRTPGMDVTGAVPVKAPQESIPLEKLVQSINTEEAMKLEDRGRGPGNGAMNGSQGFMPQPAAPAQGTSPK
jgi:pilus assembly protein CpaC